MSGGRRDRYRTLNDKLEHISIIEQFLNRELYAWETVHHINEIKDDNRIENLFVCSRSQHDKAHGMKTVSMYRLFPHWISKECSKCKKLFWGSPNVIKDRKRCSVSCRSIKVEKTCGACGTIITVPLHQYDNWKFCSRTCRRKVSNDKRH